MTGDGEEDRLRKQESTNAGLMQDIVPTETATLESSSQDETHLFERRWLTHQLVGSPHGRGRIGRSTAQPRLCGHLLDKIGGKMLLSLTCFGAHQFQGPQHQIGIVERHARHVASEFIAGAINGCELQGVPKTNGLKETSQVMEAIFSLTNDPQKQIDFAGAKECQSGGRR